MAEIWRMFIAIHLSPDVLSALATIQDHLKERAPQRTVKWVNPQGIHLTLKFLGDVPVIKRDSIQRALTNAVQGHKPFTLSAGGVGCFPNSRRPRVVWTGVHGDLDVLSALHDAVEQHIAPLGYPTENRPFNPHLTLGRIRRDARRNDVAQIGELVASASFDKRHSWQVGGVSLIRSKLKPTGAVYTDLFSAELE